MHQAWLLCVQRLAEHLPRALLEAALHRMLSHAVKWLAREGSSPAVVSSLLCALQPFTHCARARSQLYRAGVLEHLTSVWLPRAQRRHQREVLHASLSLLAMLTRHDEGRVRLARMRALDALIQAAHAPQELTQHLAVAVLYNLCAQRSLESCVPRLLPVLLGKTGWGSSEPVPSGAVVQLARRAVLLLGRLYSKTVGHLALPPALQLEYQRTMQLRV
jgi:hypothetical protein